MQRGGGDAGAGELLGEVEREHDLRQLALAVGPHAGLVALEHHVVEVQRLLAGRADVDDPRRRRDAQPR